MTFAPDIIEALRIVTKLAWNDVRSQSDEDAIQLIEKFTEENVN
jgi:hypothetical protein